MFLVVLKEGGAGRNITPGLPPASTKYCSNPPTLLLTLIKVLRLAEPELLSLKRKSNLKKNCNLIFLPRKYVLQGINANTPTSSKLATYPIVFACHNNDSSGCETQVKKSLVKIEIKNNLIAILFNFKKSVSLWGGFKNTHKICTICKIKGSTFSLSSLLPECNQILHHIIYSVLKNPPQERNTLDAGKIK